MLYLRRFWFICLLIVGPVLAEPLTLPDAQRPEWVSRDGIVMAGSWEPLLFRVRRDAGEGYTPTAEQKAAYEREHSPAMVAQLKALGVNFVMMHCYKGGGLEAERESMADAVRFSKLCHDAGLRVGVYDYSGAFIWELFFKEMPQAKDWLVLDEKGQPMPYWSKARYRYYWDRNHPDAQAFYRKLVHFAVTDIQTDLVHFDNYCIGPGSDQNSAQRFRQYLAARFSPQQLAEMGASDLDAVKPAMSGPPDNMLRRAWLVFASQSLADSYWDMTRYARTLRPDILMECNPGGPGERISAPIDHGRLCRGGEAFWDEGAQPGYHDGKLQTRIRTYKIARGMDNIAFAYTTNPLEMAESMAFNRDSLGCLCWFEYAKLVALPGSKEPVSPALKPFVEFFHKRRDLLRDARVVADVAVLRSFPSQVFGPPQSAALTARVEQTLIEQRAPFQIIYDHQLTDLSRYRVLVPAGCPALSDEQAKQISAFVSRGGRLCLIGPAGTHDEWMRPRPKAAFGDLPADRIARIDEKADCVPAIASLCPGGLAMSVAGPAGVCAELTEQSGRRLVHLVNYRSDGPSGNVPVSMRLPVGKKAGRVYLVDPQREDRDLEFTQSAGSITTKVPALEVYAIVVATFE
jgi:hypothetical protein